MVKVIVTGSAGFIFSNFVIYAQQHTNWQLVGIDKLGYASSLLNAPQTKRYKLHIGDLCDHHFVEKIFEIEKPDIVVHGASNSHVDNSIADSNPFMDNITAIHSLLEASLKVHMPQLIINFGTDEEYGQIKEGFFTEDSPLAPRNVYSATKASASLMAKAYYETHGLPIITTRCCNVFGGRQNREKLIPKVISNIITDKAIPVYGKGDQRREWIFCKDVFWALKVIMEEGSAGEVYNISSGEEKVNLDVVYKICDILEKGRELIQFVEDRKGHDFRYAISSNKLEEIGWKPQYNFDEALEHTVKWYCGNTWSWKK